MEKWFDEAEAIPQIENRIKRLTELQEECNGGLSVIIQESENKLKILKRLEHDCLVLQTNKPFLFALYKQEKLPTHPFLQYSEEKGELKDIPSIVNIYLKNHQNMYRNAEFACLRRGIAEHEYDKDFDPELPRYLKITDTGKRFAMELRTFTGRCYFLQHPDLKID